VIRAGLIGAGYWGPNLARVLGQTESCQFTAVVDLDAQQVGKITRQHPSAAGFQSTEGMWEHVDAVLVATPISTHYKVAREALERGKHVFVEKPIAHTSVLADELVQLASAKGLTLMSGHTFAYSPAVRKVREQIESGALGELLYVSLSRVNLGLYQKDVDVIWDLAVHDVSILLYWLGESPVAGACFGRACVQAEKSDVAYIWLQFPSGVIANIEVSWLSPQRMRRTAVVGSRRMIVYDDTEPSEKIKIYDRGVILREPHTFGEFQLTYRNGDMLAPNLSNVEPLRVEVEHFFECIESRQRPLTDGVFGANVVRVLEMVAANRWDGTPCKQGAVVGAQSR
jgi:predicted dehydrogenase